MSNMTKKQAVQAIREVAESINHLEKDANLARRILWQLKQAEQLMTGEELDKLTEDDKDLLNEALVYSVTKQQLARDIGVTVQTVRSWFFNRNRPRNGILRQLRRYVRNKGVVDNDD